MGQGAEDMDSRWARETSGNDWRRTTTRPIVAEQQGGGKWGDWDRADLELSVAHREELESLAAGFEASDYAESILHVTLKPHVDAFHAGSRDDFTMRQLRISNDARAAAERSRRSSAAIRAVLRLVTAPEDDA